MLNARFIKFMTLMHKHSRIPLKPTHAYTHIHLKDELRHTKPLCGWKDAETGRDKSIVKPQKKTKDEWKRQMKYIKVDCDDHKCNCFPHCVCVCGCRFGQLNGAATTSVTDVENHLVSGEILFAFFLFHTRIEIVCDYYCYYVSPAIYIWSTIAFTATVLIVWLCWLRFLSDDHVFFYQFRAQFQNSTTTKIKVPFHLRFSAYELLSLLKFLLLYVLMGFMCYMLLTINWCVFFSSGTNFNFFSVDFLTMDLRFSTFHLTFHSMI